MDNQDYKDYMRAGTLSKDKAEKAYENNDLKMAYKHYYYASVAFEAAKDLEVDIQYKIKAADEETLCLQKLDELKRFKKVLVEEITKY